jgi:hypothetical protein
MKNPASLIILVIVFSSLPASAVIVAGASGGGNTINNTTRAQMEGELGTFFPAYDNVIQYSDASGIYLGHNAATRDVWVLTARHITGSAAAITIDGQAYNFGAEFFPGGDLRLVRYSRLDGAVPSLPAVQISSTVPVASTALVVVGYGQNRTQNATTNANISDAVSVVVGTGYNWTGPRIKRWGTNEIEGEFLNSLEVGSPVSGTTGTFNIGVNSVGFMTDFDQPGTGEWLSSNEAQGSLGDSGGSAFYFNGSEWVLTGIYSAVSGFAGQAGNTAAFGNLSILTDVASYNPTIQSLIGTSLIPEPTSSLLVMISSLTLLVRRRFR